MVKGSFRSNSTSVLKPRPSGSQNKVAQQIPCPICGKLYQKSANIALEVHVFKCLEQGKDGLQAQQDHVKFEKVMVKSIDENKQTSAATVPLAHNPVVLNKRDQRDAAVPPAKQIEQIIKNIPSIEMTGVSKEKVDEGLETANQSKKQCPFYKILSPTTFSMDAFCYGRIQNCTAYFLSHFHSDHYMGLSGKFNFGPIYCSPITASLIQDQLRVQPQFVHIIPLDTLTEIQGVFVRLLDANHCPGAAIFLFEIPVPQGGSLKYLHTGDFRASKQHWSNPLLLDKTWDKVYLDTTYCKPIHTFPDQQQVLDVVGEVAKRVFAGECLPDIISPSNLIKNYFSAITNILTTTSSKKKTIFVVGTYLIGKEKVWMEISKQTNLMVYSEKRKMKVYKLLGAHDPALNRVLSDTLVGDCVHIVPMSHINHDQLLKLKGKENANVIAFRPTGWTFSSSSAPANSAFKFTVKSLKPVYLEGNITIIPLPYSEHSSFTELETFCKELCIKQIIPTVNLDPKSRKEMSALFASWKLDTK